MQQLEITFQRDPVREAIEHIDAPRLVKALLLSIHLRGGRISDLDRYCAGFHPCDLAALKRTVVGAIRRGLVTPEGNGIRLQLTESSYA